MTLLEYENEVWRLIFVFFKSLFLIITSTLKLVSITFAFLFQWVVPGASWLDNYIREWTPMKPAIFHRQGE